MFFISFDSSLLRNGAAGVAPAASGAQRWSHPLTPPRHPTPDPPGDDNVLHADGFLQDGLLTSSPFEPSQASISRSSLKAIQTSAPRINNFHFFTHSITLSPLSTTEELQTPLTPHPSPPGSGKAS